MGFVPAGGAPKACRGVPEASLDADRLSEAKELAERVGFEPTCRLRDNTLSRRARYDHFGTSPYWGNPIERTFYYTVARRSR